MPNVGRLSDALRLHIQPLKTLHCLKLQPLPSLMVEANR